MWPTFSFFFFLNWSHFLSWKLFSTQGHMTVLVMQGLKLFTGFHEQAISQFWVPFAISLCGCPHSLPAACIIWAIMKPICRGAMTSSWPRPADALPCTPITRICGGNHSPFFLSLSTAYGCVRPLPPSSSTGQILEPAAISLLRWHVLIPKWELQNYGWSLLLENCNFPPSGPFSLNAWP